MAQEQQNVFTLTMNPAVDISVHIENITPEKKLRTSRPEYEPGGGGINVSRALKKLGARSTALVAAGGSHGELLEDMLKSEDISFSLIPVNGMVRESMTVYEESSGQQYRFVMPGPRMEEEQWQAGVSVLQRHGSRGDYLVASGSLPPGVPDDFYRRLGKVASERGIRLVLDTSGMPLKLAAGHAWMVKPNVRELQQITETELTSDDDIVAAASSLIEGGRTHAVLVSLGAGGAMLVTAGGSERLRTPTVQIRSKVGAGDSMVAGTVVKLAQGVDVRIAARYGIAAGAAAVMTPGTELCRYEDTERLFKQMNGEGEV